MAKKPFKRVSEMSEKQRERIRARDRERYQRKRGRLLADPVAMERFRRNASEARRRYDERHAAEAPVVRRTREHARYVNDDEYRTKVVQKQRDYVEKNRDVVYQRNREYYARRREEVSAQRKARRRANLDQIRAQERERGRAKYERDPEAINRYNREWRRKNPEKARLYLRVSHHKRRAAAGSAHWTRDEWLALLDLHGGCCYYCGVSGRMEADHRMPLSRGGANTIANIVPACKRCNCRKNDRTEEEFTEYRMERERARRARRESA